MCHVIADITVVPVVVSSITGNFPEMITEIPQL